MADEADSADSKHVATGTGHGVRYAIVDKGGNVVSIELAPDGGYTPSDPSLKAYRSDDASPGWTWDGMKLVPPARPVNVASRDILKTAAKKSRNDFMGTARTWNVATSGAAANVSCDCSAATLGVLAGFMAWAARQASDSTETREWIAASTVTELTAAQVESLDAQISAWATNVKKAYLALVAGIDDGTVATLDAVFAAQWPTT